MAHSVKNCSFITQTSNIKQEISARKIRKYLKFQAYIHILSTCIPQNAAHLKLKLKSKETKLHVFANIESTSTHTILLGK